MLASTFILYLIVVTAFGAVAALAFIYGYRIRDVRDARLSDEVTDTVVTGELSDVIFPDRFDPGASDGRGGAR